MTPAAAASASLNPDGEPWPADAVEVGRVLGAWGVKGWIKMQPLGRDASGLIGAKRWHLRPPEHSPTPSALPAVLRVMHARRHGDSVVAQVAGCTDRSEAEALRGARVFVSRASFPRAGTDEYYWVDLIGASVLNREGLILGTVTGLIDAGGSDVLCVQPPSEGPTAREGEHLIPFVSAYVDTVDVPARRIVVDWGLDY